VLDIELYIEKARIDDLLKQDFKVKVLMGDYGCRFIRFDKCTTKKGGI